MKKAIFTISALIIIGYLILSGSVSYIYALHLESKWSNKVSHKSELEAIIYKIPFLVQQKEIEPSKSEWGNEYHLNSGERMVQYTIMWQSELDIVYDENEVIVKSFTSYE